MRELPSYKELQDEVLHLRQLLKEKEEKEGLYKQLNHALLHLSQSNDAIPSTNQGKYKLFDKLNNDGIVVFHEGVCMEVNSNACELLKYSSLELIGQPAELIFPDFDVSVDVDSLGPEIGLHVLDKEGNVIVSKGLVKKFKYEGKDLLGIVLKVGSSSLNEVKNKEEHFDMFRAVFNTAGVGIVITDKKGKIVDVNPSFAQLIEIQEDRLYTKQIEDVFRKNSFTKKNLQSNTIENGVSIIIELELVKGNGSLIPVEVSTKRMSEEYYISLFRDISRQKNYQQELLEINNDLKIAKDKAEESDKLKSKFLANMSHEIRTPMNGIVGFSELLLDPDLREPKRRDYANIIINSSNQLLQIIDDILEVSRLETKHVKVNLNEVNLNSLMLEIFNLYSDKAKDKKLSLHINKGLSDNNCTIQTDNSKLLKILYNLINNALRYTNEGHIEIGYAKMDDDIEFYVKDTGVGIPKHKIKMIFDRFSQGDSGLSNKFGGLGLGLSIARENAELLGGQINVESVQGKGSTFKVRIPHNRVNKDETVVDPDFVIMIAEDEELSAFYLEILIKKFNSNIRIVRAKNGREAIELFRLNHSEIDAVFIDLKMPEIDGLSATKEMLKISTEVPIIAQTAYITSKEKKQAVGVGCAGFITKPVKEKEVLATLEQHLEKTHQTLA